MGIVYSAYDEELDRRVAIKLLKQDDRRAGEGRARMLREAQAMARLSHPNVVQVYDVGEYRGQVFLAMELVEGLTLGEHLRKLEGAPRWRARLDVCVQAGRGLVAAHAAGLIHRDFKPDNVLVRTDGVPRVSDFGLARAHDVGERDEDGELSASASSWHGRRSALSYDKVSYVEVSDERDEPERSVESIELAKPLTRAGALIGTPAYMSPEQLLRRPVSTKSDQFSFCVVVYEALYGERPFAGADRAALTLNIAQRRVRPPPRSARAPTYVREALLRGLSPDPDDRWPSMDALLKRLRGRSQRPWRLGLLIVITAGVFTAGGYLYASRMQRQLSEQRARCTGAAEHLAGVWDDERRDAVERALLATGLRSADDARRRVREQLDRYSQRWVDAHTDACEATRVRGEQSEHMLDLRMACLQRLLHELDAFTSALTTIDAESVSRAVQLSLELAPLSSCEDLEALRGSASTAPPPEDAAAVRALQTRLLSVSARARLGAFRSGLTLARELSEEARQLGYAPLVADSLNARARAELALGEYTAARATALDAFWAAESVGDDRRKLESLTSLVEINGELARLDEALEWGAGGQAIVARVGASSLAHAELLTNIGYVHWHMQDYDAARSYHERALALYRRLLGPDDIRVTRPLFHLGRVFHRLGDFDESRRLQERALAISEAALGPEHPRNADFLNNLGNVAWDERRFEDARAIFERNIDIYERAFGPEHPALAGAVSNLGDVLSSMGRHEQALASYERALRMYIATLGADHPRCAFAQRGIGEVLYALGDYEGARPQLERALATAEAQPFALRLIARTRFGLARVLWELGDEQRARALELGRRAEDEYARSGEVYAREHKEVVAWLAARDHVPRTPAG